MPDIMSSGAALTQLIPVAELAPGAVAAIRNQVINALVAQVSKELVLAPNKLVVRDVRPFSDLQLYSTGTTDSTSDRWGYAATGTAIGFTVINASTKVMADQRWVALFGVRDKVRGMVSGSATISLHATGPAILPVKQTISLIKINVGGADKAIWDTTGLYSYDHAAIAGFTPSAVVIPQNATFQISYYRMGSLEVGTTTGPVTDEITWLQLVGVVIEPIGKVVSP